MDEQIIQLAQKHGLADAIKRLAPSFLPAIHIAKIEAGAQPPGRSRLGGLPDVPPGFVWPCRQERPLGFVGQFRCDELAGLDEAELLPRTGMLYFFYDLLEQPWGFDPKDQGGSCVIHLDDLAALAPASVPAGAKFDEISFAPFHLRFDSVPSPPSSGSRAHEQLDLTDLEARRYLKFYDAVRENFTKEAPNHQLLGHANVIQGDMQLECQLVTHGLYCGDASGYKSPQRAQLETGADEWRLLFQFDSDDDLGVMWGDCGMVYFWIRESDLRAKQFSKAWAVLQCG